MPTSPLPPRSKTESLCCSHGHRRAEPSGRPANTGVCDGLGCGWGLDGEASGGISRAESHPPPPSGTGNGSGLSSALSHGAGAPRGSKKEELESLRTSDLPVSRSRVPPSGSSSWDGKTFLWCSGHWCLVCSAFLKNVVLTKKFCFFSVRWL